MWHGQETATTFGVTAVQLLQPPAIRQCRTFLHDDDSVADADSFEVAVFEHLSTRLDADVVADAAVLVDDRPIDVRTVTDSQWWEPLLEIRDDVFRGLIKIGTHQNRIADDDVAPDAAAQADHAVL